MGQVAVAAGRSRAGSSAKSYDGDSTWRFMGSYNLGYN